MNLVELGSKFTLSNDSNTLARTSESWVLYGDPTATNLVWSTARIVKVNDPYSEPATVPAALMFEIATLVS